MWALLVLADGEDHRHRIRSQPARDDRQGLHRGGVEPLRVVDHAHHGPLGGSVCKQGQHGQPDQEPVRWLALREA
jgi:hypothetical protein